MTDEPRELEPPTSFSRSLLWQLQRASYQRQGLLAWRPGGLPLQITSNPFIARGYADVIAGFVRDRQRAAPARRPLQVVELGAGSGRFGFYLLRALVAAFARDGDGPPPFRLIMTDLVDGNLEGWLAHPRLRPFVDQGLLDVARFDAEQPAPLALLASGEIVTPDPFGDPVVAIANYFFDTIPHDAYRVEDGRLVECLVGLDGPGDRATSLAEPEAAIDGLRWRIAHAPARRDHGDPIVDALLTEYEATLDGTTMLLPVAGFATIDYLASLGGGRLLLLSSDKGHRELALRDGDEDLTIVRHPGCVSVSVNYHALARYTELRGGFAVPALQRHEDFYTGALGLGFAADELPRCQAALDELERFGPGDYQRLVDQSVAAIAQPSVEHVLTLLRLGSFDPRLVLRFAEPLAAALEDRPPGWLDRDLVHALEAARDLHYTQPGRRDDLLIIVGTLLFYLRRPELAVACLSDALDGTTEDASTYLRLALCWLDLARPDRSMACLARALELAPDLAEARRLQRWLEEAADAPGAGPVSGPRARRS